MRILFKYILKSICEKKARTLLVIICITISSALFLASNALSGSIEKMFLESLTRYYGQSDIVIHANGSGEYSYVNPNNISHLDGSIEFKIGGFIAYADYLDEERKNINIEVKGFDYDQLQILNSFSLENENNLFPFEGRKVIISSTFAKKHGMHTGDNITLKINGQKQNFTISGIANPTGFFYEDGNSISLVVPKESLELIYGRRGTINKLYIRYAPGIDKQAVRENILKVYKGFGYSWFSFNADGNSMPFRMMTYIVCFMSIFIIYSTFKVITAERLPAIGTFRSIGAKRRITNLVMLAESMVYGLIGGLLGCAAGIGILYIMSDITKWDKTVNTSIVFTPLQLVIAFAMAPLLCLASSLIPIIKASRIPIKDIILNQLENKHKINTWKAILGFVFLVLALILPYFRPLSLALPVDMSCLLMLAAASILLVPYVIKLLLRLLEGVYGRLFGNEGILAAKNLRDNKSMHNSIALLSTGIATLFLISTIFGSMSKEVLNTYANHVRYDLSVWVPGADKNTEQLIKKVDGVKSVYGAFSNGMEVEFDGRREWINLVAGIDTSKHLEYIKVDMEEDTKKVFEILDSGRNILLCNTLNYTLGLKKGDKIILKMQKGPRTYTVTGFYDTGVNNGQYAMISNRFFKLDMGHRYYSNIFIKTDNNPQMVAKELNNMLLKRNPVIRTVKDMEENEMNGNKEVFFILQGFSILTMLMGVIGIINNLLVNFIERKHSLAILCSVGMSRKQTVKMIVAESLIGGLCGGITGVATGSLQLIVIPFLMKSMGQFMHIQYSYEVLPIYITAALAIMALASVSPAYNTSKFNLIESIKYE